MTGPMTGTVALALQVILVAAGAPLLIGLMRQVRARLEGRAGAGVLQPWRDLRKLARREPISPPGSGVFFTAAPPVLAATSLLAAAVIPLVSTRTPLDGSIDLIAVVGLLLLGTVALALAGLDTGTAFGGMGASREMTIAALVEPTLLLSVLALSVRAGTTNLGAIVEAGVHDPSRVVSPAGALAAAALAIAVLAEAGRLPVDNPATHLELTMVHEAMTLEYSGRDLALVEWAAAARTTLLLGLLATLFLPWGVATGTGPLALLTATAAFAAKTGLLAAGLAAAEVWLAKVRLFRVPELLAGSFVLALLAVMASFMLV
ncbi:Formate hydrogenlyase subunit 4 [Actinomadura madurae]|uniref:Formate hydrogenlyase subunit 4 n=2 Tax=Thermomonosporaceae TaxID=2012 RepID=A0A1I5N7X4_9ACTN|nr:Formate hydrogenlyase subunit 4 [Actinomadura madurae]